MKERGTLVPEVTMFSTTWCGHCIRLKRQLDESGIAYTEVDIDLHEQYGAEIEQVTGGFRTVPTLKIGGSLLVNPSLGEVKAALAA